MSKVLITGATGFIGRAVCRALRNSGHTLSGTSRDASLRAGPENIPLYHVPEIGPEADWAHPVVGADVIVHLAARTHVMKDRASDPLFEHQRVNRDGTQRLAEAAVNANVKRIVFVSTIKVNGEMTTSRSFSESDAPSPQDPYAISKWEAEQVLAEIGKTSGLEVVILRAPLVYGPYVKGNFFTFMEACARRRALPLGAISNSRSLIYVDNLASAIVAGLNHPAAAGKTFLVCDGEDVSTPELVRRLSSSLGVRHRLYSVPLWILRGIGSLSGKRNAIDRLTGSLQVDGTLITHDLQWSPPVSVQDALDKTARWYLESQSAS